MSGIYLGRPQAYRDYLAQMARLWELLYPATIPGGKLVLQAANMKTAETVPATLVPLHWDLTYAAMQAGFLLYDEILWLKMKHHTGSQSGRPLFGSYPYPGNPKMLNSVFENLSVLTKPGARPAVSPEIKERSRLPWSFWKEATNGCWDLPSAADPEHPATFSPELARRVIRLYSFAEDLVLDPFAGTGTTLLAAEELERRGLGFELRPEYIRVAARRATAQLAQLKMPFLDTALPEQLESKSATPEDALEALFPAQAALLPPEPNPETNN